jgi:predicted AAA+ superfamily ATPase
MQTIERNLRHAIRAHADKYPVVAVTGPRQSGKTTLLKALFPDYTYLSLENPDLREFAERDPNGFFAHYSGNLLLDEAQRVPSIFSYIQTLVDASGKMGQFILSGSQNFQLLQSITQSLAGRVALFKLLPLDFSEMSSAGILPGQYATAIVQGAYPAIHHRGIAPNSFYSNYIQTYVERDISEVIRVRDTSQFRKFLSLCAGRAGQLLNLNAMANECGISQPTAKAWLSVLQSSYIVFLLQPYHANISKRLIKTPKLYFYDTGLLAHLLHITHGDDIPLHALKGSLFENLMVSELMKQNHHHYLHREFWFWRDTAGNEVDVVMHGRQGLHAIELKASQTVTSELFKGLVQFENSFPSVRVQKTLIHGGATNQQRSQATVVGWRSVADVLGLSH